MASSKLEGSLDLRSLLNIDQADRVFQELLRRLAAQSAELVELREAVSKCVTGPMLHTVAASLKEHTQRVERRIDCLEAEVQLPPLDWRLPAATSWAPSSATGAPAGTQTAAALATADPGSLYASRAAGAARVAVDGSGEPSGGGGGGGGGSGQRLTLGEVVVRTAAAAQEQAHTLAHKADAAAVASGQRAAAAAVAAELEALKDDSATAAFASALGEQQAELRAELEVVRGALGCKADKSAVTGLEAAAARLAKFDAHVAGQGAALVALTDRTGRLEGAQGVQGAALAALGAEAQRAQEAQAARQAAAAQDLHQLSRQVGALGTALSAEAAARHAEVGAATQAALEDASEAAAEEAQRSGAAAADLRTEVAALAGALRGNVLPQLDALAASQAADAATTAQALKGVKGRLDCCATHESLGTCFKKVGELSQTQAALEQQLQLSLRFIDWFSARGGAYEHNLKALDAHLGKLTPAGERGGGKETEAAAAARGGAVGAGTVGFTGAFPVRREPFDPYTRVSARTTTTATSAAAASSATSHPLPPPPPPPPLPHSAAEAAPGAASEPGGRARQQPQAAKKQQQAAAHKPKTPWAGYAAGARQDRTGGAPPPPPPQTRGAASANAGSGGYPPLGSRGQPLTPHTSQEAADTGHVVGGGRRG